MNWSTWLSALVSCKDRVPAEFKSSLPEDAEEEEPVQFNLLKATGDLLMLPKDILLDPEIRKEVYHAISNLLNLITHLGIHFVNTSILMIVHILFF